MPGMLSGVADIAARGFQWWTGELASIVPGAEARDLHEKCANLIINLDAKGALLSVTQIRRSRALRSKIAAFKDVTPEGILEQLATLRPGTEVCVRLPHSACLLRQVDLPATARRQAASILTLDFERSTPFKLSDVYVSHTVAPAAGRKGWLSATQYVVKRKAVEHTLATIETLGLKITRFDCWAADGQAPVPLNFLDRTPGGTQGEVSARPLLLTLVAVLALAVSATWLGLSHRESALQTLEADVSSERAKADVIHASQSAVEAAKSEVNAVHALKASQLSAVETVNELTRLLPDDIVLSDLKIEGGTVDFSGLAKSSAAVLPALERSAMFKDATLTSPVTYDASAGKERFSMRLRLRHTSRTASVAAETAMVPQ